MACKLAFRAAPGPRPQNALKVYTALYGDAPLEEAECLVCLGGDGFLLETLHYLLEHNCDLPVYGQNYGTLGFLLNPPDKKNLLHRLERAQTVDISPLKMRARRVNGETVEALGFNDIYLFRQTRQTIHIGIEVDGKIRMADLASDGIILATPAGSTAYNRSADGPIVPLDANILPLTPISPCCPRHWRGALLPHLSHVKFTLKACDQRPAAAVADFLEVRDVVQVEAWLETAIKARLLFNSDHQLSEKIVKEQFSG